MSVNDRLINYRLIAFDRGVGLGGRSNEAILNKSVGQMTHHTPYSWITMDSTGH